MVEVDFFKVFKVIFDHIICSIDAEVKLTSSNKYGSGKKSWGGDCRTQCSRG